jgi:hypothetical protein
MRRAIGAVVLSVLVGSSLAACTVPQNGVTGVSVDADGHLVGVLAWCDDRPPDSAVLYDPGGFNGKTLANYTAPTLTGQSATFRLDEPVNGWRLDRRVSLDDPELEYHLFGGTRDSSTSTRTVAFHIDVRDRLSEGSVFFQSYQEQTKQWVDVVTPREEFERQASSYCS